MQLHEPKSSQGLLAFESEHEAIEFLDGLSDNAVAALPWMFEFWAMLPSYSIVLGVTGRVTSEITGTGLTSWSLGIAGSTDRYGTGYGLDLNSYAKGLTSHPLAYWSDTPLEITPDAGIFSGGSIAFAVHIVGLTEPGAV